MFTLLKTGILLFLAAVARSKSEQNAKRILLSDPDVITNRLDDMDKKIANLQSELADEKAKNVNLRQVIQTITRFAAGQHHYDAKYTRYGGPANSLCLPNDPELSNKTAGGQSFLYGTEYEENFFASGALEEDVPCAVCRSTNTSATIMIPGRKTCYFGWKIEYNGFLASNAYYYRASSYKCIDVAPEFVQGGKENKNGNLLYSTGTKCGALPCPPYTDNMAVNCVVCSK